MLLTKAQRQALKRVYMRVLHDRRQSDAYKLAEHTNANNLNRVAFPRLPTYREFRKTVQPSFGCDDCVMVPFAGMWLGIERDGYTHS